MGNKPGIPTLEDILAFVRQYWPHSYIADRGGPGDRMIHILRESPEKAPLWFPGLDTSNLRPEDPWPHNRIGVVFEVTLGIEDEWLEGYEEEVHTLLKGKFGVKGDRIN